MPIENRLEYTRRRGSLSNAGRFDSALTTSEPIGMPPPADRRSSKEDIPNMSNADRTGSALTTSKTLSELSTASKLPTAVRRSSRVDKPNSNVREASPTTFCRSSKVDRSKSNVRGASPPQPDDYRRPVQAQEQSVPDWTISKIPENGRTIYVHTKTGKSQYNPPPALSSLSAIPSTSTLGGPPPSFQQRVDQRTADQELLHDDYEEDFESDEEEEEDEDGMDAEASRCADVIITWFMDRDESDREPRGNSVNKSHFFLVLREMAMEKPEVVGYLLREVTKGKPHLAIDLTQDLIAGTPKVLDHFRRLIEADQASPGTDAEEHTGQIDDKPPGDGSKELHLKAADQSVEKRSSDPKAEIHFHFVIDMS